MAEQKYTKATYHTNAKAAEFIADDGTHVLRSGGSLSWRINNCGNLVSPTKAGQPAPKKTRNYIGFAKVSSSDHFYFIFPDYETGRAELCASLKRKYSEDSIPTMMEKYAPPNDNNDTDAYISALHAKTKVAKDKKLKDFTGDEFNALMDGIETHEGYHNETSNDGVPRKTTVVAVSTISATDGARPIADEEIVLEVDGKKTTLKSNHVGQFPPIPHGDKPIKIHHKTADGELKEVGQIDGNQGQHYSLLTRLERFFGFTGADKPPEQPTTKPPFQPVRYQVKPGDSLVKIADKFKKFKITVEDLKRFNKLESDQIFPGELLSINGPKADGPLPRAHPKKAAPKAAASPAHPTSAGKPAVKKAPPPASTPTTFARSNEGDGAPLALVPPDHRHVPWMEVALGEARKFKGKDESLIEKERNYAKEANTGETTIVGEKINGKTYNHAWCAAFVNWCLMQVGYSFDEYLDKYDRGRAHAFYEIHGKKVHEKDKERPLIRNPLFRQIDQPIFGSIAMATAQSGHGHHVGFVYAKSGDNELVLLGGNQGDTINFSPFNIHPVPAKEIVNADGKKIKTKEKNGHLLFFVPTAYYEQAQKDDKNLEEKKAKQLNKDFGINSSTNEVNTTGVKIT